MRAPRRFVVEGRFGHGDRGLVPGRGSRVRDMPPNRRTSNGI